MQITINDASITRIINDGKLVEEIPVRPPPPAVAQEKQLDATEEGRPVAVEQSSGASLDAVDQSADTVQAAKSPKGGK